MIGNLKKNKKLGLALGSGAFRGFAHLGVIRVLEKNNIPIDFLSGCSVGAWVAAHYSIFRDIDRLEEELLGDLKKGILAFLDPSLVGGFVGGQKLHKRLEESLGRRNFSDLYIPLKIVATDLVSGGSFVFKEGSVSRAVRASISVPLFFKPLEHEGHLLVDGALSNPVPVEAVNDLGAGLSVAVNLYHQNEFVKRKFTISKVALRSSRIFMHNLAKADVAAASIVITPDCSSIVRQEGWRKYFTLKVAKDLISIGEEAAAKAVPSIKKLLS